MCFFSHNNFFLFTFSDYKPTELEVDYPESSSEPDAPPSGNHKQARGSASAAQQQQQRQQPAVVPKSNASNQITSVYDKPRAPPKIRRPVPINERDRYDYMAAAPKTGQQSAAAAPTTTTTTTTSTTTTTTTTEAPSTAAPKPATRGKEQQRPAVQPVTEETVEYYDDDEEEYVAEPEAPVAPVRPVAAAVVKPAEPIKPAKAAARTAVVADYDTDRSSRPRVAATRPKVNGGRGAPAPQPQPVVTRKRPVADRVAADDEYEDELPAAATRQTISAATKQRVSGGPFVVRPQKTAVVKTRVAPAAPTAVEEEEEQEEPIYQQQQQQPRQSQRVSVRHVMSPSSHRQQYANNKHVRAAPAANRRPMRPVYEYADEYYDE